MPSWLLQAWVRLMHGSFFLLLAALIATEISVTALLTEQSRRDELFHGSTLTVAVSPAATDAQIRAFLEALLKLPQTRDVRVQQHQRIGIVLRSIEDVAALSAFLERSELQELLLPQTPGDVRAQSDFLSASFRHQTRLLRLLGAASIITVLLLCMSLLHGGRLFMQHHRKHIFLARLAGATPFFVWQPVIASLSREFLLALACASAFALPLWWVLGG